MGGDLSIQAIAANTAQRHGVELVDMMGKRRFRHLVAARFEAIQIAHGFGYGIKDIGEAFDRDHTSVVNALKAKTARQRRSPGRKVKT